MDETLQSANINTLWLKNILDNLVEIQKGLRRAREGCTNLNEYIGMQREQIIYLIPDIQYKNLSLLVTDISIIVQSLAPILKDKLTSYNNRLDQLIKILSDRKLFIQDARSQINKSTSSKLTVMFTPTLEQVDSIFREIILDIGSILYLTEDSNKKIKESPRLS